MRRAPNAGFLLAETLITFALSALVLVGLVASASVLLRATDRSVASVGATDELGRTLAALGRDVSELRRARWNGEEPQSFVFRGGPNSLYFAQESPAADGGRELRVVSLREIEVGRGTALMRAEAHLSALAAGWGDLTFGPARAVATGPARLRFHYVAEAGPDGRPPKPVDRWPSGPTLPAAVIVEAVEPATTRLLVSDRIAVRADGDIGCADKRPPRRDDADKPASGPRGAVATGASTVGAGASAAGTPGLPTTQPTNAQPVLGIGGAPQPRAYGFSIDDASGVANKNEFCGRADKGLAAKAGAPTGVGFEGRSTF